MKKINPADLSWETLASPKGTFAIGRKNVSIAMGAPKDTGRPNGHAFDVALNRIPPGKRNWPLHAHGQQTEFYIILSGHGTLRLHHPDGEESRETLSPGDCVHCPPDGNAHQIINDGDEDLVFWVIADSPPSEVIHYPDSGKYGLKPDRLWGFVQMVDDPLDGEE